MNTKEKNTINAIHSTAMIIMCALMTHATETKVAYTPPFLAMIIAFAPIKVAILS